MVTLARFSAPGNIAEPTPDDAQAWSDTVSGIIGRFTGEFPQFYDLTERDTPHTARTASVEWTAFPARLLREATSQKQRWQTADRDRSQQDEYCEWSVERSPGGGITRVTFSSEVRELWNHVAERDPVRLVAMYHDLVDDAVQQDDLFEHGKYVSANPHNESTEGRLAHLIQQNNNLAAAVDLAAKATILRFDAKGPVTHKQALVRCAGLGDEFRNSDPQIAAAVNDAAARGADIALADPPGLHLAGITTVGMTTPDGADPASFWTVERGQPGHAVRAAFAVPPELGYGVSDVRLAGRPIEWGAQLADRVRVRLDVVVTPAGRTPDRQPCS